MRPPHLNPYQSRLKLSACVCFIQRLQAASAPSGSVKESRPKGKQGIEKWSGGWQAPPLSRQKAGHTIWGGLGFKEPAIRRRVRDTQTQVLSLPPTGSLCRDPRWLPFRRADPSRSPVLSLPVDLGTGLVSGARRPVPGVLLPESLPAILLHVVFRTFTFKGGDEES